MAPLTLQKPDLSDRGVANRVAKFRIASGRAFMFEEISEVCNFRQYLLGIFGSLNLGGIQNKF